MHFCVYGQDTADAERTCVYEERKPENAGKRVGMNVSAGDMEERAAAAKLFPEKNNLCPKKEPERQNSSSHGCYKSICTMNN